eukprot:389301-Amphidinium_carterae.1
MQAWRSMQVQARETHDANSTITFAQSEEDPMQVLFEGNATRDQTVRSPAKNQESHRRMGERELQRGEVLEIGETQETGTKDPTGGVQAAEAQRVSETRVETKEAGTGKTMHLSLFAVIHLTMMLLALTQKTSMRSVGRRCMTEGYSFVWPKGSNPYFIDPRGIRINFQVDRCIPYLIDTAATPDMCEPEDITYTETDIADPEYGEVVDGIDILDIQQPGLRSRQALQEEAKSKIHRLTHLPKNPFCNTCMRAKVTASRSPRTSGSELYKEAKKFGDV